MRTLLSATLLFLLTVPTLVGQQNLHPDQSTLEAEAERRYAEDDLDGAVALYKRAAEGYSSPSEKARVLIAAAWIEHYSGETGAAAETMVAALRADPEFDFQASYYSESFVAVYRRSLDRVRREIVDRASKKTTAGAEALSRGARSDARQLLNEALELRPDSPEAVYNLALVDLEDGRTEEAMAGFQRLLAMPALDGTAADPETRSRYEQLRARALNNLGLLYVRMGYYEDSERVLEESIALDAQNAIAWTNLGVSRRRLGRQDEALEALERAYHLQPDDPAVVNNLAMAHLDAREWQRAADLLQPAAQAHSDVPSLWLNLGLARRGLGDSAAAVRSLEHVAEIDADNRGGYAALASAHLALVHFEAGELDAAAAAARRTLELDNESVEGWVYLGLAQHGAGDYATAQRSFERALELDPTRATTANNLGNAYFANGDYEQAEAAFKRAVDLRPDFATASENLALTRQRLAEAAQAEQVAAAEPAAESDRRTNGKTASPPPPSRTPANKPPPPPPPRKTKKRSDKDAPAASSRPAFGLELSDDRHAASGLAAARVVAISPGSQAAVAGLEVGDLVVRADNSAIGSAAGLRQRLLALSPGQTIPLDVVRGQEIVRVIWGGSD